MSLYSVVVPVYNSAPTLQELYDRVRQTFDETMQQPFELILVDDGSKDGSFDKMYELHEADSRVKAIQLANNFGQPSAILCGFGFVQGDFVLTIDDDLQHPPEEIPKLVEMMDNNADVDVILGKYEGRKHNAIRRLGTRAARIATTQMFGKDPELEMTSFRLMRRFIVDEILTMNVRLPQIGNLLLATSGHIINVPVRHDARKYGHSGYTFRRLARDLYQDIITHTALPLIWVRNIGIASFILSVILGIYYFVRFLLYGAPVEGWLTLVLLLIGYSGIMLLSIGIIGQYLINILDEARKMPNYVIRRKEL